MSRRVLATSKYLFKPCTNSVQNSRPFAKMLSDPENKGERQDHVNFDTLGTWDNRIDFPMLLQQSIKVGKPIPRISAENIGFTTVIGRRKSNEDRFVVKELTPDLLYFAVFDGHGGSLCAQFCKLHLEEYIKYWLNIKQEPDLEIVLMNSFIEINNAFARYITYNPCSEYSC